MEIDDYLSQLRNELDASLGQIKEELSFCPECGTRLVAGTMFCPECGTRIVESTQILSEDHIQEKTDINNEGILFTNTVFIADKYGLTQADVKEALDGIIRRSAIFGIHWHLLDVAGQGLGDFWLHYNEQISDFMEKEGLPYGMKTHLFIIGGDDVIPIPMVEDTFGSSDDGQMPCDMCYAFSGNFFSDLWDGGDRSISEDYVRNTVSRLPLEDGEIETSLYDDLVQYFESCEEFYTEGIPVDRVMMSSNASWLPASHTMSEHLPLVNHATDEDMVEDDMYVCPPVEMDDKESIEPVYESMEEAGMLLFNLHGAGSEGMSGFYHDGGEAFSTEMLESSAAYVLNTVACYGARYHGFDRDDSMMLSAIYNNGFLLYAGSLISVPMTDLDVPEGVEVHPGSGSEHLMPIYCMEQFAGLPAGEAMMKAKLEYFNTFRHLERDDFSLVTTMMFSLYGNPFLRLQRNEEVLQKAEQMHVLPKLPQSKALNNAPIKMKQRARLIDNAQNTITSLLADIRGAVDANLSAIHQIVQNKLYNYYGLEPRWLRHVDSYTIGNEKGYLYTYVDESKRFANKSMAEVDTDGSVRRIFKMK